MNKREFIKLTFSAAACSALPISWAENSPDYGACIEMIDADENVLVRSDPLSHVDLLKLENIEACTEVVVVGMVDISKVMQARGIATHMRFSDQVKLHPLMNRKVSINGGPFAMGQPVTCQICFTFRVLNR